VYINLFIYIYVCISQFACTYIYIYMYIYIYIHVCGPAWHACVRVGDVCACAKIHYCVLGERASRCFYEYILMCFVNFKLSKFMFACMYVCIYIYIYIYRFRYM